MTFSPEAYLWFKTLHIVGVVVWFAGLFYLVRLFIYHVETAELAEELQQPFRDQYSLMEKRLANIITTPGMVVAVSMAIGLLVAQPSSWFLDSQVVRRETEPGGPRAAGRRWKA